MGHEGQFHYKVVGKKSEKKLGHKNVKVVKKRRRSKDTHKNNKKKYFRTMPVEKRDYVKYTQFRINSICIYINGS